MGGTCYVPQPREFLWWYWIILAIFVLPSLISAGLAYKILKKRFGNKAKDLALVVFVLVSVVWFQIFIIYNLVWAFAAMTIPLSALGGYKFGEARFGKKAGLIIGILSLMIASVCWASFAFGDIYNIPVTWFTTYRFW